jgi:hypothetical protein
MDVLDNAALPEGAGRIIARTNAPLRVKMVSRISASPEAVFSLLGDLGAITRLYPMIKTVRVRHRPGADCAGEGSERACAMPGMGALNEKVVWWSAPSGFAYKASGNSAPIRDHLGVILLAPDGEGGTRLEWRHYFHTRFGPLGWMFPFMMKRMMRTMLDHAATILGARLTFV